MEPGQLTALRFLPFLAEATAVLGTSWLLKRWMRPPSNFGGRYWRSLLASIVSLPVALVAVFTVGVVASLAYQSVGGQYENFSGGHISTFMAGTLGRTIVVWPFVIAWLVVKPRRLSSTMTTSPPLKQRKGPQSAPQSIASASALSVDATEAREAQFTSALGISRRRLALGLTIIGAGLALGVLILYATMPSRMSSTPRESASATLLDTREALAISVSLDRNDVLGLELGEYTNLKECEKDPNAPPVLRQYLPREEQSTLPCIAAFFDIRRLVLSAEQIPDGIDPDGIYLTFTEGKLNKLKVSFDAIKARETGSHNALLRQYDATVRRKSLTSDELNNGKATIGRWEP